MRNKILSFITLNVSLGIILFTLNSNSTGQFQLGINCGGSGCHGNNSSNTTVLLGGLPSPAIAGQTYTLTATINNSTQTGAGFNLATNGGTFTAGSNQHTNGSANQITHSNIFPMSSGTATINITWTAPTTPGTVIFSCAGNAVNGNANPGDDEWNVTQASVSVGWPAAVNDLDPVKIKAYPNPVSDLLTIENYNGQAKAITIYDLDGKVVGHQAVQKTEKCEISCSSLSRGYYILKLETSEHTYTTHFTK